MLVIPKTKHIESKMFDFPLPFRPVIELKLSSLTQVSILTMVALIRGCLPS